MLKKLLANNGNKPIIAAMLKIYLYALPLQLVLLVIPFTFFTGLMLGIGLSGIWLACLILFFSGRNLFVQLDIEKGMNLLGHWQLTPDEARRYAQEEAARWKKNIRNSVAALVGAGLLASLLGFIPVPWHTGLLIGAVIGFYGYLFGKMYGKEVQKSMLDGPVDIYVTYNGIRIGDVVHDWSMSGRALNKVTYNEATGYLLFTYYVAGRYGNTLREVLVPVPPRCTETARSIELKHKGVLPSEPYQEPK